MPSLEYPAEFIEPFPTPEVPEQAADYFFYDDTEAGYGTFWDDEEYGFFDALGVQNGSGTPSLFFLEASEKPPYDGEIIDPPNGIKIPGAYLGAGDSFLQGGNADGASGGVGLDPYLGEIWDFEDDHLHPGLSGFKASFDAEYIDTCGIDSPLAEQTQFLMRAFDTTLGQPVYWIVNDVVDETGAQYTGPGPLTDIVWIERTCGEPLGS